jgi:hypothetical protein
LLTAALPAERRVLARRGWAGENSSLFEHPARRFAVVSGFGVCNDDTGQKQFFCSLLIDGRR